MAQTNWGAEDALANARGKSDRAARQERARREDRTNDVLSAARRRRSI
jgi:hypothetical protein